MQAGERLLAVELVAARLLEVAADDEASARLALPDPHLLDVQALVDDPVAALAGERRAVLRSLAQLLAEDVVAAGALQVGAVLRRGEAGVGDPDHAVQPPLAQRVLNPADDQLVRRVALEDEAAHRDPLLGDREPDDDLRQIVAMILALAEGAEAVPALGGDLEVGRGRVEQDQVDLEVQEVGDREEHLALDLLVAVEQEVHRPVEDLRVAAQLADAGQPGVCSSPLQGGELRHRLERPVGDQREQEPLHERRDPPARRDPAQCLTDAQPPPEIVEHPGAAHRPRLQQAQLLGRGRLKRLLGLEEARDRAHQPRERLPVEPILAPEAVDHPGTRLLLGRVPHVVRQLYVADLRPVLVAAPDRPQIHMPRTVAPSSDATVV